MKVSDIIIYIIKIMGWDFKKIRSSRFRDTQKSAESPNLEVALMQVVRKRVSFQGRKNESKPKFPSIKTLY